MHVKKSVFTPSRLSMVDHPPQCLGLFCREDVGFLLTSSGQWKRKLRVSILPYREPNGGGRYMTRDGGRQEWCVEEDRKCENGKERESKRPSRTVEGLQSSHAPYRAKDNGER